MYISSYNIVHILTIVLIMHHYKAKMKDLPMKMEIPPAEGSVTNSVTSSKLSGLGVILNKLRLSISEHIVHVNA